MTEGFYVEGLDMEPLEPANQLPQIRVSAPLFVQLEKQTQLVTILRTLLSGRLLRLQVKTCSLADCGTPLDSSRAYLTRGATLVEYHFPHRIKINIWKQWCHRL